MTIRRTLNSQDVRDVRNEQSALGDEWVGIFSTPTDGKVEHFEKAMENIIRHPNLNSTVIMRADILQQDGETFDLALDKDLCPLRVNVDDVAPRTLAVSEDFTLYSTVVRRIVPRNPQRDPVINQTCLIYRGENASIIIYIPHLDNVEEIPYYLPPARGVAIMYNQTDISVHYAMFDGSTRSALSKADDSDRSIRIALRLLETSAKHSSGARQGYQKRVNHDVIVDKVKFQDRYVHLKQKYAKELVANWVESTDPKKHVFEDLAIAAFLITLWDQMYTTKTEFQFADLGCGNGLLVHLLVQEGYTGFGIDARARKSWSTFPKPVQASLHEQVLVPRMLLEDDAPELSDPRLSTLSGLPDNTFLIGNHSDELTVWIPLLGFPFMVIPCCSHALTGAKHRFPPVKPENKSTYACLVDHVEKVAGQAGWEVEQERLRIPSTRNAALIGRVRAPTTANTITAIIDAEGVPMGGSNAPQT